MNWTTIAFRIPEIISRAVHIVDSIKVAGSDKKKAVEIAVKDAPEIVSLFEFAVDKDVLNDPNIVTLMSALIDAEAAALKARNAFKAGLLAKQAETPTV